MSFGQISYNNANQLLSENYGTSGPLAGVVVAGTYDKYLRRTALAAQYSTTPLLQHSFAYDAASRLQTVTDNSAANNPYSAAYSYLANSPLVGQVALANNGTTQMTTTKQYDFLNRLTQISSVSSASSVVSYSYLYNNANQRVRARLADGSYWVYTYDALGQVIGGSKYWSDDTPVVGQQFQYAFDNIGNRTSTGAGGDQNGQNLRSASYTANNLNQYTSRTVPGGVDIIGLGYATNTITVNGTTAYRKGEYFRQQLSVTNGSAPVWEGVTVTDGTTDVTGSLFVPQTPETFAYDADGNLLSDGHWNYSWDAENRLVAMAANTTVGPQISLAFQYDWKGRRILKQVWSSPGWQGTPTNSTAFVYDGWNLIAELNNAPSPPTLYRSYLWGLDLSGSEQGAGGVGALLEVNDPTNGVHFAAFDGNGNVAGLVSASSGTSSAVYEYGPFGEPIRATGAMARANHFRPSTKYQDDETDLLYYGYRYLSTSTGRWVSRDPIGEQGGPNLFVAAGNNPLLYVDPVGLTWTVRRHGERLAQATCDSCTDTWDDLARKIRLDTSDYTTWARTADAAPRPGKVYLIPNTVYLDKGIKWVLDIGPLDVITIFSFIADDLARSYRAQGFRVVKSGGTLFGIKAVDIMDHLDADDIYIYGFFGHGEGGWINTAGFWGGGTDGVMPGRYTRYGISMMILFACESLKSISHTDPSAIGLHFVTTPWETNVARRGVLIGFEGDVSGLDLLTHALDPDTLATAYPGTNSER